MHLDRSSVCAVYEDVMDLLGIVAKRRVQIKTIFRCQSIQDRAGKASLLSTGLPSHYYDCPLIYTKRFIRDHKILIKLHLISQSKTLRAGTEGIIKGEASRFDLLDTDPTIRTGEILAEIDRFTVCNI